MPPVKTYQIMTNLDCNLRCRYCYEKQKAQGANDLDSVCAFLDAAAEDMRRKAPDDVTHIEFIGGETFLHMELLRPAVEHFIARCSVLCPDRPFILGFTTNGTLFARPEVRDFLRDFAPYLHVGFSIDGTRQVHDANRVDASGNGTYDRAVEGYRICRAYLPDSRMYVKATFNHATVGSWEASVRHLMELGFRRICANVVFEETWTADDYPGLLDQMIAVADHLVDHQLLDTVFVDQLNRDGLPLSFPVRAEVTGNYCGACRYMRCLGFDGKVYGCQKFASAQVLPVGQVDAQGLSITRQDVLDEVSRLFEHGKAACGDCGFRSACPVCLAEPYLRKEDPAAYFRRRTYCGFTCAMMMARLHIVERLEGAR